MTVPNHSLSLRVRDSNPSNVERGSSDINPGGGGSSYRAHSAVLAEPVTEGRSAQRSISEAGKCR